MVTRPPAKPPASVTATCARHSVTYSLTANEQCRECAEEEDARSEAIAARLVTVLVVGAILIVLWYIVTSRG
jgi:uncharacterized protein (DUF983 family)